MNRIILREVDTNSGATLQEKQFSAIGIAYTVLLEREYEFRQVGMTCPWSLIIQDDISEWDITNIQARTVK